jgi:hypothetical protein
MSSEHIERLENIIRVVSGVPDDKFDILRWYNPLTGCGCAIGHAAEDAYFIARRFALDLSSSDVFKQVGAYFGITEGQARSLFVCQVGYSSRKDVLAALRVVLLEKMALDLESGIESDLEDQEWNDLQDQLEELEPAC